MGEVGSGLGYFHVGGGGVGVKGGGLFATLGIWCSRRRVGQVMNTYMIPTSWNCRKRPYITKHFMILIHLHLFFASVLIKKL